MRTMFLTVALLICFGAARPATAQSEGVTPKPPPLLTGGAFYLEEDAFNLVHGSDRNYTGGGALSFSGDFVPRAHLDLPISGIDDVLQTWRLYSWMEDNSVTVHHAYDFSFGVTVFTPQDLRHAAPIHNDRPYGSLDFLHVSHLSFSERVGLFSWLPPGLAVSSDFTLGVLGLQQGHDLQALIHHISRQVDKNEICNPDNIGTESPPEPCGWGNQISAGGEPTALYAVRVRQKLVGRQLLPYLWFDATATAAGELGYYVDAAVGGEFRFGIVDSPFWLASKAPLGFASMAGQPPHDILPLHIELYLWGGFRGKAVAYNALLEGQFRHSEVRVTAEPLLYEFETGLTLNIWALNVTWAPFVGRSSDFVGDGESVHMWTSFFIGVHQAW